MKAVRRTPPTLRGAAEGHGLSLFQGRNDVATTNGDCDDRYQSDAGYRHRCRDGAEPVQCGVSAHIGCDQQGAGGECGDDTANDKSQHLIRIEDQECCWTSGAGGAVDTYLFAARLQIDREDGCERDACCVSREPRESRGVAFAGRFSLLHMRERGDARGAFGQRVQRGDASRSIVVEYSGVYFDVARSCLAAHGRQQDGSVSQRVAHDGRFGNETDGEFF